MKATPQNNKTKRLPIVAVIGASCAPPSTLAIAREVGAGIGEKGWNLLTGGGSGVMEAACQGFVENRPPNGGVTIGILPSEEISFANPFIEVPIPTGMGWARNAIIARTAWALVSIAGCSGTLSEMAFAWQMNRPIVAMATTGGWSEQLAGKSVDNRRNDTIFAAGTASDAITHIESMLRMR